MRRSESGIPVLSMMLAVLVAATGLDAAPAPARPATICYSTADAPVRFAAAEIHLALAERGFCVVEQPLEALDRSADGLRVVLAAGVEASRRVAEKLKLPPARVSVGQAYSLRRRADGETVICAALGFDARGAMYGGLDLAEAIRLGTLDALRDSDHAPHIAQRGLKFNIPLDVRTPSYSDCGDSFQQNIPEMWSFDFWREFLDEMARDRYNVLTLWSLHPFPSIVKVPEYPDVALDDVLRTTLKLDDTFDFTGLDMVRPAMLQHVETVRKMTIGQKIQLWRDVMQHAHDRGIEVYFFTWNIFVFGTGGKYGITPAQDNPVTIDYFRRSVRQTILTYPLLAGIGITSGEQMQDRKDEFSKEKWLWKTYGEGIRDAQRLQPGRAVKLIHRYHQTGLGEILKEWKEYPGTLDLSYKYAVAHMHSSPAPPFARSALAALPSNLRMWMTVRNDDIYSFRWGWPAYARQFIRNLPGPDKLAGYYMGPDGYCWGREFISTEPETPRQLVITKQWYSFTLWGRLSYEPTLPDELFVRMLAARYPAVPADRLFQAWSEASQIVPQITRFFWGDIDLKWFPEACLSHPRHRGFYTVKHFMEGETMPASGILSIRAWRQRLLAGQPMNGITPLEVAAALHGHADATLKLLAQLEPGDSKELRLTLGDLEAMSHLGHYYAEKILGASALAIFEATGEAQRQADAVKHLESALEHWRRYAAAASRQYRPQLLNRVGHVDLNALVAKVEQDVEMARRPRD